MASSPLPDLPGGGTPSDMMGMIGQPDPAQQLQQQQTLQDTLRAEVGRVHALIQQCETIARAHPEAASDLRRASEALGQSIMKITQTLTRGMEGPQPPVLG